MMRNLVNMAHLNAGMIALNTAAFAVSTPILMFGASPPVQTNQAHKETKPGNIVQTTVMLRNMPSCFTRTSLVNLLDAEGFAGQYDFVYLPIDFKTRVAMGYAFVNLISTVAAELLKQHFDGFVRWPVPSGKRCYTGWSDPHQGFDANVARYRNSPLMHCAVPDEFRPAIFQCGHRVQFPEPTKRVKPPRKGTERMLI